jgi:PEP-CTERM motif
MPKLRLTAIFTAAVLASGAAAKASVLSPNPTLPLLGIPFMASGGGPPCFPAVGVCAVPGSLTFTSVVPSPPAPPNFNPSGQDIIANATLTAVLTMPGQAPQTVVLTGTVEQEVLGRTFATETGEWPVDIIGIDLSGPVLGHTLSMGLDDSKSSTGMASVERVAGSSDLFSIDSFFDVFVELSLDTPVPLHTTRSAHLALLAIPEPASLTLLAGATLGLAAARRRRRRV